MMVTMVMVMFLCRRIQCAGDDGDGGDGDDGDNGDGDVSVPPDTMCWCLL